MDKEESPVRKITELQPRAVLSILKDLVKPEVIVKVNSSEATGLTSIELSRPDCYVVLEIKAKYQSLGDDIALDVTACQREETTGEEV